MSLLTVQYSEQPLILSLIKNNILVSNTPRDSPFELKIGLVLWHNLFSMFAKSNSNVLIFWLSKGKNVKILRKFCENSAKSVSTETSKYPFSVYTFLLHDGAEVDNNWFYSKY